MTTTISAIGKGRRNYEGFKLHTILINGIPYFRKYWAIDSDHAIAMHKQVS